MSENETVEETVETTEESAENSETEMVLTEEENNMLMAFRQRANQITAEIGALEVRKARLIGAVSNVEAQANQLLQEVAQRLGIPQGQSWQVTPEGEVIVTENV